MRAVIGVTGQFAAVDDLLTGGEPAADGGPAPSAGRRRKARGHLAAGTVRSGRIGAKAGVDLFRRHAPQAGPGDDAGHQAGDHLPGRADHGPGSAQPPHDVEHRPRAGGRWRDHLPDHPVPRGSRPARRPDRGTRPGPPGCPGRSRRTQAPGTRQPRPAPVHQRRALDAAARILPGSTRDDGPDPAGSGQWRDEVAAGPAGPARRTLDRGRGPLRPHTGPR